MNAKPTKRRRSKTHLEILVRFLVGVAGPVTCRRVTEMLNDCISMPVTAGQVYYFLEKFHRDGEAQRLQRVDHDSNSRVCLLTYWRSTAYGIRELSRILNDIDTVRAKYTTRARRRVA